MIASLHAYEIGAFVCWVLLWCWIGWKVEGRRR